MSNEINIAVINLKFYSIWEHLTRFQCMNFWHTITRGKFTSSEPEQSVCVFPNLSLNFVFAFFCLAISSLYYQEKQQVVYLYNLYSS